MLQSPNEEYFFSDFRNLDYQASSPDEKALVEGCAKVGYLFTGEKGNYLNVKLQSQRVSESFLMEMIGFGNNSVSF